MAGVLPTARSGCRMSDPVQVMTLTEREMSLAKWIERLVTHKFPDDDRVQITALCQTANVLAAADENGLPETDDAVIQRFGLGIKQGCEARGGKRFEAAVACIAVALAKVKEAGGFQA